MQKLFVPQVPAGNVSVGELRQQANRALEGSLDLIKRLDAEADQLWIEDALRGRGSLGKLTAALWAVYWGKLEETRQQAMSMENFQYLPEEVQEFVNAFEVKGKETSREEKNELLKCFFQLRDLDRHDAEVAKRKAAHAGSGKGRRSRTPAQRERSAKDAAARSRMKGHNSPTQPNHGSGGKNAKKHASAQKAKA